MVNSEAIGEKCKSERAQRRVSITHLTCYIMWAMGDNKILRLSKPEQMYIIDVDFKHFILKSNLETQYSNANK